MKTINKTLVILGVIFGIFFILVIIGTFLPEEKTKSIIETKVEPKESRPEPEKATEKKQPIEQPQKKEEWVKVAEWRGSAIKNTETFTISSKEWVIIWATRPGEYGDMNFQIYVYKENGNLIGVAANVIGKNEDSSIMRGAGRYYLMINTAQPYVIQIMERK